MKEVRWIGSSQDDVRAFPEGARLTVGRALRVAQGGGKSDDAKPLQGFGGASVLEVVASDDGDAYRAVYTVRFEEALYVLHCFQKKSRKDRETPKSVMDLVRRRLREAERRHEEWLKGQGKE